MEIHDMYIHMSDNILHGIVMIGQFCLISKLCTGNRKTIQLPAHVLEGSVVELKKPSFN
jgi:hypothetical protein